MSDTAANTDIQPSRVADYFALLKPRVMSLVVFTAAVGLLVAPGNIDPLSAIVAILMIAIGGGASGALNMWWDADIDILMRRTANRPVPAGRVSPIAARNFGLVLSVASVTVLALITNWAAGAMLGFTIFFYVVIYTMWLKRSTPWNIVIGGASGAFPPIIGWLAVTGSFSYEPLLMFGLVFMWTPPHFWALSLFMNDDYSRAKVPMLTVTHGRPATRNQILIYTILLVPTSLALAFSAVGGVVYLAVALWLNFRFVNGALKVWRRDEDEAQSDRYKIERKFFRLSLLYLFGLFVGLLAEITLQHLGVPTGLLANLF